VRSQSERWRAWSDTDTGTEVEAEAGIGGRVEDEDGGRVGGRFEFDLVAVWVLWVLEVLEVVVVVAEV
jgi:hypothetical protein